MRPTVVAAGAVAALGALWGSLALAATPAEAGTATVGDTAEAWYPSQQAPPCTSPVGCLPVSPAGPAYPTGTLHVGMGAGREQARTYVQPDLSGLPAGAIPVAGTMTLPLATASGNGNSNTSSATIEACLAAAPAPDSAKPVSGSPPAIDCGTHANLHPGPKAFTLDLAPFLAAWAAGHPEFGVALVPDTAGATPLTFWHVAFNGHHLAGVPHISSVLSFSSSAGGAGGGTSPIFGGGSGSAGGSAGGSASPAGTGGAFPSAGAPGTGNINGAGGPVAAARPVIAGLPRATGKIPTAIPNARAPAAGGGRVFARITGYRGFQYPEVMLLPLALFAGVIFVVRLLTTDATPRKKPA